MTVFLKQEERGYDDGSDGVDNGDTNNDGDIW